VAADVQGASVLTGRVDAGIYNPPVTCSLDAQGLPEVFNFATSLNGTTSYPAALEALKGIPGFGYYAQSSWANSHPQVVTGFQTAIREAANWAVQPQNAAAVADMMRKSEYNVSTLSSSQWQACSKGVTAAFSTNFSMSDVTTWNNILKESNLGFASLPSDSTWIDKGALSS
jgi:ABC-type nitrate/sulfonate/bicarbonate transport system substrate-binding protein